MWLWKKAKTSSSDLGFYVCSIIWTAPLCNQKLLPLSCSSCFWLLLRCHVCFIAALKLRLFMPSCETKRVRRPPLTAQEVSNMRCLVTTDRDMNSPPPEVILRPFRGRGGQLCIYRSHKGRSSLLTKGGGQKTKSVALVCVVIFFWKLKRCLCTTMSTQFTV